MADNLIGRVIATEKRPTTMDTFTFWTSENEKLHAFDIVKVEHIEGSFSYGVIQNISHITDAQSFLTSFISSDFGDVDVEGNTARLGMNYVEAAVSYNSKGVYTPVHSGAKVCRASVEEITTALGLGDVKNPLVCGAVKMYADTASEISLSVPLNAKFLLGPEGAHLNISGISGLAAKTSYAMFLMKAAQERYMKEEEESVAYVIFNVKGKDLLAIHEENDFSEENDPAAERARVMTEYRAMGLTGKPFEQVRYYIPYAQQGKSRQSTYLGKTEQTEYEREGILKKFKYTYADDKESVEMLFSDIDDPQQTMDAIINKIIDATDADFSGLSTWDAFREKVDELSQKNTKDDKKKSNEISVLSWRKFKRIINKAIRNDDMFANRAVAEHGECRLTDEIRRIQKNDVYVIDIAKLSEDKQAFVFGDAIRAIYNLKLGEYDDELDGHKPPTRIVVFIDELNKYASKDTPKSSAILREILDVTERGRSLGVVLFGAEQFRSNIHPRVTGNCSTHAYGRTNTIETETKDYKSLPPVYKNMLTRLAQGDYLIQNPMFRSLLKIQFPKPVYKQFKG